MTYAAQAAAAKSKARDILRTEMAVRIMGRVEEARQGVISALKSYGNTLVSIARATEEDAEAVKEREDKREAFDRAIADMDVAPEDRELLIATVAKQQTENDRKNKEDAEAEAEHRKTRLANAKDAVADARTELEHHQENLTRLEAGDLKVDADQLAALTTKLIGADKSVPEGTEGA